MLRQPLYLSWFLNYFIQITELGEDFERKKEEAEYDVRCCCELDTKASIIGRIFISKTGSPRVVRET